MDLPWEHSAGDPDGEGICLSGGGLRSAAFSLGALQALQQTRGLLYGPEAADYLSVVSGGSYVAATLVLTGSALSDPLAPDPLSPEAPETLHVLSHGRYLIEDGARRTAWRFGWRVIVNLALGVILLCWTAVILADAAYFLSRAPIVAVWAQPWRQLSLGLFFVSAAALAASGVTDRAMKQRCLVLLGFVGLIVSAPSAILVIKESPALSAPSWWLHRWHLAASILGAVIVAALVTVVSQFVWRPPAPVRFLSDLLCRNTPRVAGIVLTCYAIEPVDRYIGLLDRSKPTVSQMLWFGTFFFGTLLLALVTYMPDVATLHRPYRDLLSRCFAVRRTRDGAGVDQIQPPTEALLSTACQRVGGTKMPRLLICATANVRSRRGARRLRSNVATFVFSHDRSGLSGVPDASFTTNKLELGRARVKRRRGTTVPELSLMDAVAMTGAALAPSMGSMTMTGIRPILALADLRLGVWLPNPLSSVRRDLVEARPGRPPWWSNRKQEYGSLGPRFEALLGEFFGLHGEDAPRIFVTDGGHYDNLGLLTLLRARCRVIWCVDAYQGRSHLARQLERVIGLAQEELDVRIDIDTSRFRLVPGSDDIARHSFAVGTIAYPDTSAPATLIVLKLALTPTSPDELCRFCQTDHRFPYQSTGRQWLNSNQFEHYRQLGHYIASEAIAINSINGQRSDPGRPR